MDSICEYVFRNNKKTTVEEFHIDFLGISTCCLVGQDKILCLQELIPFWTPPAMKQDIISKEPSEFWRIMLSL